MHISLTDVFILFLKGVDFEEENIRQRGKKQNTYINVSCFINCLRTKQISTKMPIKQHKSFERLRCCLRQG